MSHVDRCFHQVKLPEFTVPGALVPKAWEHVRQEIAHMLGRPAYICGGALRDLENGARVKDVDIFVRADSMEHMELSIDALQTEYGPCDEHFEVAEDYRTWCAEVLGFATWSIGLMEYQVIFVDPGHALFTPEWTARRCDFGICQIVWDGEAIYTTEHYVNDKREKTFTLVVAQNNRGLEQSMRRWARISQKYAGWKVKVNDNLLAITDGPFGDPFDAFG